MDSKRKKVNLLTPVKDKAREAEGKACWRLSIPSSYSSTGRRMQKFFSSFKKAQEVASAIRSAKAATDAGVELLNAMQAADA